MQTLVQPSLPILPPHNLVVHIATNFLLLDEIVMVVTLYQTVEVIIILEVVEIITLRR